MSGDADDELPSRKGAHVGERDVLLAHVHAVGMGEQGQIHVVVHDEAGSVFSRRPAQDAALLEHAALLHVLFAVLQDADAGAEQGFGNLLHAAASRQLGVRQGVEFRFAGQNHGHDAPPSSRFSCMRVHCLRVPLLPDRDRTPKAMLPAFRPKDERGERRTALRMQSFFPKRAVACKAWRPPPPPLPGSAP